MVLSTTHARLLVVLLPLVAGCGGRAPHPRETVERGRLAVEAAPESWKRGESVSRLKALPETEEFTDDDRTAGRRPLDYRLLRTDPAVIRYTVTLTLQDRRGRRSEREVTYSVALKSPTVVARDPYF
jgi:hypothetical protein